MTRKIRQIKSGVLYLTATMIESVLPLITLPIFTRILSVEDYGAMALATVYGMIVAAIANFGLNTAYNRNYFECCENRNKSGKLFFTTLGFVFVLSVFLGLLTYVFRSKLSQSIIRSPDYGPLIFWSYIGHCLINMRIFFLVYLRNMDRPKQYVLNTIALSIVTLVVSIYLVVFLRMGVMGVVWGQVTAAGIVLLGLLVQILRELPFGLSAQMLKDVMKIGGPTVPMVFFSFLSNHFDKYMIAALTSIGGVGIYSVGQKIATTIATFTTSLQNVFSPRVFQKMFQDQPENRTWIGNYLFAFFYLVIFLALAIALLSEEIVWIFVPPKFHQAADVITLLSLYYAILFFAKINADQIVFAKKTYLITMLIIGAGLLNVLLNIAMILMWGVMGAAAATLVSRTLAGLVIFKTAQKFYRIEWPKHNIVTLLSVLFGCALTILVLRYFHVAYSVRLAFKLSSMVLFICTGYWSGLFSQDNIISILTILKLNGSGKGLGKR